LIADFLGIDTKMRKYLLIEEKAKHLSTMQRIEVWKMATGFSIQSYYNMKNKYQRDKFDENKALEKELEDIENAIEEVSGL
jgi:PIN domain nuclease of toxin-antitoxin system